MNSIPIPKSPRIVRDIILKTSAIENNINKPIDYIQTMKITTRVVTSSNDKTTENKKARSQMLALANNKSSKQNIIRNFGHNQWIFIYDFLPLKTIIGLRLICKTWNINVINFLFGYQKKIKFNNEKIFKTFKPEDHEHREKISKIEAQLIALSTQSKAFNMYHLVELRSIQEPSYVIKHLLVTIAMLICTDSIAKINCYSWADIKNLLLSNNEIFNRIRIFNPLSISHTRYQEFIKRIRFDIEQESILKNMKLVKKLYEWAKCVYAYLKLVQDSKEEIKEYYYSSYRLKEMAKRIKILNYE